MRTGQSSFLFQGACGGSDNKLKGRDLEEGGNYSFVTDHAGLKD